MNESHQLSVSMSLPLRTAGHGLEDGRRVGGEHSAPHGRRLLQAWMQQLVQACNAALHQVHEELALERGRRLHLEAMAQAAQAELWRLHAELAGCRAGEVLARHQSLHDGLTQLPNSRHVRERLAAALDQAVAEGTSLAVFYIDLDGFKDINDVHGHAAGDELLAVVAARLRRAIRADDLVGRMGGDEFVCLLMNLHEPQWLSRLACKVYDSVSAPINLGGLTVVVRPSIGIAVFPTHAHGAHGEDGMLHAADLAMYQAKRAQTGYAFAEVAPAATPTLMRALVAPSAPGCAALVPGHR